jgi:uncharacterized protein
VNVLLQGVGGSVAHGLARLGSDVDRYGVYAAPTLDLVVPWSPEVRSAIVTVNPDSTLHEAGSFAQLLAGCNPTVMETLWLPEDLYEVMTPHGQALIDLRTDVLEAARIRAVYSGYLTNQVTKLQRSSPVGDRKANAAKLVRHGLRVREQAMTLLETGRLEVRPADPFALLRYDADPADGVDELVEAVQEIRAAPSPVLPERRGEGALDGLREWVRGVRLANLT